MLAASFATHGGRRPGAGRPAKPIPTPPRCLGCDNPIQRRRDGYSLEAHCHYIRRKFCGWGCQVAWRDRTAPRESQEGVRSARSEALEGVVLDHIDRRTPKPTAVLHDEIVNDWGSISKRQLVRVVSRLRRTERIVWTDDGYVRAPARRAA